MRQNVTERIAGLDFRQLQAAKRLNISQSAVSECSTIPTFIISSPVLEGSPGRGSGGCDQRSGGFRVGHALHQGLHGGGPVIAMVELDG